MMEYIGEYIKPFYDGFTWDHGDFTRCPVENHADEYMECIKYVPEDTVNWDCVHCNGTDICSAPEGG
jgi:hypothetical protein